MTHSAAEKIAQSFHDIYGEMAPNFGVTMAVATRRSWGNEPRNHQLVLINTIRELLDRGIIEVPEPE